MTQPDIYQKIKTQYETEKGKRFILHLIRAYYPSAEPLTNSEQNDFKCCITDDLLTRENAYQGKNTDTIMCFDAVTALRQFASDNKGKDDFIKRACTINRLVNNNGYSTKKKVN